MNRFALLDESDDDVPKQQAAAGKDKKAAAAKKPNAAAAAPAAAAPAKAAAAAPAKESAPKKADSEKKPRAAGDKKPRESKPKDASSSPRQASAASSASAPATSSSAAVAEGDDAGKADRQRNNKSRDSRREKKNRLDADKPSIKPSNRRTTAAHGGERKRVDPAKDEALAAAADAEKDPASAEPDVDAADVPETSTPEVEEVAAEPEPVTFTLDEYMKKREEARAASALLAASKAAPRVAESLAGLKIKEDDESAGVYTGSVKAKKEKAASQRSTGKTVLTDLTFAGESSGPAASSPREERPFVPRGDRAGGRGGGAGRGGRGSGGGRGPATSRGPKIDFSDTGAFPSL